MRLNKYLAQATGISRRAADTAIAQDRVVVNGQPTTTGQQVDDDDQVSLDDQRLQAQALTTIMLHKPTGYVCSRQGQGSKTIYDLLPTNLHHLKPVGRLDKDSSGLLLLTNDGQLANQLTHPSFAKQKIYEVKLDHPLQPLHRQMIQDHGISLGDGPSRFPISRLKDNDQTIWQVNLTEGRNRQIRRTFAALGYNVTALHRTNFGPYLLGNLPSGHYKHNP